MLGYSINFVLLALDCFLYVKLRAPILTVLIGGHAVVAIYGLLLYLTRAQKKTVGQRRGRVVTHKGAEISKIRG